MLDNFVKICLDHGCGLYPLLVPHQHMPNPSLMNPTIIKVDNELIVNLRNVNYILYHAEKSVNEHAWGPLCYLHPENEMSLATHNIICYLDNAYNIKYHRTVDTSKLDVKPLWEFIGLEDVRLAYWNNKLYQCGVRRDTTTNGQGRMELSEIVNDGDRIQEVSRTRMPAPPNDQSYCEKNWMPIADKPFHFVKWTNPTEVVRYDFNTGKTETVILSEYKHCPDCSDLRGGSQVIPLADKYIALVHEVNFCQSEAKRKNADYYHRFVIWNRDFELLEVSERFNFMNGRIEFACGMCVHNDKLLMTFGFQDNASYLLEIPITTIESFIKKS